MHDSLRRLVIDDIVSSGGDTQTGFFPGSFASVWNYFKLSRSTVSKLWNQCCQEGSIAPLWKRENPNHLKGSRLGADFPVKIVHTSILYFRKCRKKTNNLRQNNTAHCNDQTSPSSGD